MAQETVMKKNEYGEYTAVDDNQPEQKAKPKIYQRKESWEGTIAWVVCIILVLAIIHFSCQAGTATGYVGGICKNGFQIQDIIGVICCAPLYLLIIVLLSGGLRIW